MRKTALLLTLALFTLLAPAAFAEAPAELNAACAEDAALLQTPVPAADELPELLEAPVEATPGCYQWEVDACNQQCAPEEGILIFRHHAPCECICSASS